MPKQLLQYTEFDQLESFNDSYNLPQKTGLHLALRVRDPEYN